MGRNSLHQPQTEEAWVSVLESAKADARKAIASGEKTKLTALGRAYYEKFTKTATCRKQAK